MIRVVSITAGALVVWALAGAPAGPTAIQAQDPEGPRCFELDIEDPDVLFMLRNDVQGEILVLTEEPLQDSPGASEGMRAFIGIEAWRRGGALFPGSWHWTNPEPGAVRIGFVLPLWGIVWEARETADGLAGTVTYYSDDVSESPRTTGFTGTRTTCA